VSNELSVIKNALAQLQLGVDEDTLAVAGGPSSNKRISIKGGVFRKFAGGKEVAAVEDRHLNVVFVKMAHNPSRMYYEELYTEGARISPSCWSTDSKTPDPDVKNPKASACDKCQFSVKGSAANGKSSACRLSWRTAVVLPNDPSGDVMQLVIPGGSIWGDEDSGRWPFRTYIKMLASNNISATRVVTKMQFDTKSPAPKLLFSPVAAVDADTLTSIVDQGKSQAAELAVKLTVFHMDDEKNATSEEPQTPAAPKVAEPVLRKTESAQPADSADIIKRWSKK
jgi:hypothetical protein